MEQEEEATVEEPPVPEPELPNEEPSVWSRASDLIFGVDEETSKASATVAPLEEGTGGELTEGQPGSAPDTQDKDESPTAAQVEKPKTKQEDKRVLALPPLLASLSPLARKTPVVESGLVSPPRFPHAAPCGHFICTAANAGTACIMALPLQVDANAVHAPVEPRGEPMEPWKHWRLYSIVCIL